MRGATRCSRSAGVGLRGISANLIKASAGRMYFVPEGHFVTGSGWAPPRGAIDRGKFCLSSRHSGTDNEFDRQGPRIKLARMGLRGGRRAQRRIEFTTETASTRSYGNFRHTDLVVTAHLQFILTNSVFSVSLW
jgi:hypothetical protein